MREQQDVIERLSTSLACGVFWFLHISKTGGTSVQDYLVAVARRSRWKFVNLEHQPCDPRLKSANIAEWAQSPTWQAALHELRRPRPRLLVHQHHCSQGLGAYLLPQLLQLKQSLKSRGCSLLLGTVLREPTSWIQSAIFFTRTTHHEVRRFASSLSDYQVKFITFGYNGATRHERWSWPAPWNASVATPELAKRALQTLSSFSLIGRTDRLAAFTSSVAHAISVDPPEVPHHLSDSPHPFELTKEDMAWIRRCSVADTWLWNHTFTDARS